MLTGMTGLAHGYYIALSCEQNNATNDYDDDDNDNYHGDEIGNIIYIGYSFTLLPW